MEKLPDEKLVLLYEASIRAGIVMFFKDTNGDLLLVKSPGEFVAAMLGELFRFEEVVSALKK